ncbi:hypothetical protein [Acidithiobacillus sp.]|uniref:hypothetical protein n=1 Tax=Acidithiobacillus sp. TaxID=1872118 RepID=UPI002602F57D|nr:hypothetical protein [Acidithiobacillus sp.]MDD2749915.1 hypothetical protein [Acidithiobacillus sp.]MDD5280735.1 hypothetical protein [Acidithiobacillus sp.]
MQILKHKLKYIALCVSATLMTGCSMHAVDMSVGALPSGGSKTLIKSPTMKKVMEQTIEHRESHMNGYQRECPISSEPFNRCDAWRNMVYLGPISVFAAEQETGRPVQPRAILYTRQKDTGGGILSLAGAFMPVTGIASFMGSMALTTMGNSNPANVGNLYVWGNSKDAFVDQAKIYNAKLTAFNSDKFIWVAHYYGLPIHKDYEWAMDVNQSVHTLASLASSENVKPLGWSSLGIGNRIYSLSGGFFFPNVGVMKYVFNVPAPQKMPELYPVAYYWINQAWRHPEKAVVVVPGANKTEPFTAIAAMEYRIQPGFSIPKWIQAHEADLTSGGWMVIYHQGDHAMVWKDGKTQAYPEPKDLVLKK